MSAILTMLFAGLGRRFAYWSALIAALGIAVWILLRQGKHAAEADLAIRTLARQVPGDESIHSCLIPPG